MNLNINYRFHLSIYYEREKMTFDDKMKSIEYIVQSAKFDLQSLHKKMIVGIYIDKSDIKKYGLIKNS